MAERGRAQGRAGTWPGGTVAAPWLAPLPGFAGAMPAALRRWAAAEVAPGRLMPWLPVGFGFGIVLYFTAEREPVWWVTLAVALAAMLFAFLARARPIAFPVLLGIAAVTAGFATANVKARLVDHVVLRGAAYGVSLTGFVERREEFERSDRIVLRVSTMEGERLADRPERVRISVRKGTAPAVGSFVALKARLNPPSSRFGPADTISPANSTFRESARPGWHRAGSRCVRRRRRRGCGSRSQQPSRDFATPSTARIRATLKGDTGAIASALITGKRDALTGAVFDAMFVSGVGHVLSISGYHMALVAGVVFFFVRAVLALFPALALRHPIKKWAALAALAAATFYLVLSGAEVATQRSYIMTAVVLIGVMVDRPGIMAQTPQDLNRGRHYFSVHGTAIQGSRKAPGNRLPCPASRRHRRPYPGKPQAGKAPGRRHETRRGRLADVRSGLQHQRHRWAPTYPRQSVVQAWHPIPRRPRCA